MSDELPVDYHSDGRAVDWNYVGILGQGPAEIKIGVTRWRSALTRRINVAEWFRRVRVVYGDGLGAEIHGHAGIVVCNGVQLLNAVARRSGASRFAEEVARHF